MQLRLPYPPPCVHNVGDCRVENGNQAHLSVGVAVEGKVVLGTAGETGDLVLLGKSSETGGESSGGLLALEAKDVGSETSNVGRSHRGTGDGVL